MLDCLKYMGLADAEEMKVEVLEEVQEKVEKIELLDEAREDDLRQAVAV